jgi:putative transposase
MDIVVLFLECLDYVQQAQTEAELKAVRHSVSRGSPFGGENWVRQTANTLLLNPTLRPRGRPRKHGK